ncbi:hypothetical protein [Kingella potus]|uniref:hypothetical protein n=1 Tax=Kingella potus TaxID=265175 RepID=UPI001FD17108|nr:hypothetical protein [Kingella potus]UOP01060.1 hypothetical protein LVJ84_01440 [Kingella potus]
MAAQRPSETTQNGFSDGLYYSLSRLRGRVRVGALPLRLRLRAGKRFCKPPPPPQPSPARAQGRELGGCRTNRFQPQSASFRNIGSACVAAPHTLSWRQRPSENKIWLFRRPVRFPAPCRVCRPKRRTRFVLCKRPSESYRTAGNECVAAPHTLP